MLLLQGGGVNLIGVALVMGVWQKQNKWIAKALDDGSFGSGCYSVK